MKRLNWLFTLSSLNVVLVTLERFSFTGKILLPGGFLRLHELVQITTLILATVILPFLILFTMSKQPKLWLLLTFAIGIYFYATGNGLHEVSSFNFNNFCNVKQISGPVCQSFFVNDYYTGNIVYFIGGLLMVIALLWQEKLSSSTTFSKNDFIVLVINAVIYSLAIFAYAAFDVVLVGMIYAVVTTAVSWIFFLKVRKEYLQYPVITYTTVTYTLGTLLALIVRH